MPARTPPHVAFTVASMAVAVAVAVARLPPVPAVPAEYRDVSGRVVHVCRTIVRQTRPTELFVFALAADVPDGLLELVHVAVGAPVLLTNGTDRRLDVQAALMVADRAQRVMDAIDGGPGAWDPMSHYAWLFPALDRSQAKALFRAAWRRRSVINVVIVTPSTAYTYNPFRDALREQAVDASGPRAELSRRKTVDMNGHPVRICMFETKLNAVKQPDGSYKGVDGAMVSMLAARMNFTPVYTEPPDGLKFGWSKLDTTTNLTQSTGLMGELLNNKADVAFNGVFLQAYHSNNLLRYTTPVTFDEICFVVPNAQQMSQLRAVFTAFDVSLWYFLAITFGVTLGSWMMIKRTINAPYSFTKLVINLYQMFIMVPCNRVPDNVPERLMVLSVVLFGFITATSLQAVMVKYLSYPKYEKNIATLQDLYGSGLPILSTSTNLVMLFEMDDNPLYVKISERFVIKKKIFDTLDEVAYKRSSAAIGRKNDLLEKISTLYIKDNHALLHIVDECPRTFHMVYLIRRDIPYRKDIDRIITKIVESGIVDSWFMHAKPFRPLSDYSHQKDSHKVFSMKNVVIAFICLTIGLTVSGIVFVVELIYFRKFVSPKIAPTTRYPRKLLFTKRF